MLDISQNYAFKEGSHFVLGKVVGKLAHFVKKVNIFVQNKAEVGLENRVDEEVHMWLFENMRNILK